MPKIFYGIIAAIILLVLIFFFTQPKNNPSSSETESVSETATEENITKKELPLLVLDAGHGGFDPGKVGVNGELEKDINLAIVFKLQKLLEEQGFSVALTRDSDTILAPANSNSKKKDDMIARIEKITELNPYFTISIHQNSYTTPDVNGPQVFFYKDSEASATMAQVIQNAMNEYLQPSKHREAQANSNYYLLTRTPTPTVIVECGFLSNPDEATLLSSDEYQTKVAEAIALGILSYYEASTSNPILSE